MILICACVIIVPAETTFAKYIPRTNLQSTLQAHTRNSLTRRILLIALIFSQQEHSKTIVLEWILNQLITKTIPPKFPSLIANSNQFLAWSLEGLQILWHLTHNPIQVINQLLLNQYVLLKLVQTKRRLSNWRG